MMSDIPLIYFLYLGLFLFCMGVIIIMIKKSMIMVLIGIELMLNAANLNLIAFSRYDPSHSGQVFSIFSVVIAAGEVAIALAIFLNIYKHFQSSDLDDLNTLGG